MNHFLILKILIFIWNIGAKELYMIQNIILFLTLIVLLWYTIETFRLRKQSETQTDEIIKQRELSIRPFLRVLFVNKQDKDDLLGRKLLVLTNEGTGPAININIKIKDKIKGPNKDAEITFLRISVINKNDQCNIWESYIEIIPMKSTWEKLHYISPGADVFNEYILEIRYQDILNNNYIAIMKTNIKHTDSFEIIEQKRLL